jgi:hypothetical protein
VTEWQAGLTDWSELPDIAAAALADGFDGPSLRNLAGLLGLPWTEIQWQAPELLAGVAAEVGVPQRTQDEALEIMVHTEARLQELPDLAPTTSARPTLAPGLSGRHSDHWSQSAGGPRHPSANTSQEPRPW